jgi:hypothetical protein
VTDSTHEAAEAAVLRFADAMRYQQQRQDGLGSPGLKCTTVDADGKFVHLNEPQLRAVLAENARMREERASAAAGAAGRLLELLKREPGILTNDEQADLRAIVARNIDLECETTRLLEYVAALNESQVSLQTSAFRVGWQPCRDKVSRATELLRGELAALDYGEELRKLNADDDAAPQQPAQDGEASDR